MAEVGLVHTTPEIPEIGGESPIPTKQRKAQHYMLQQLLVKGLPISLWDGREQRYPLISSLHFTFPW